MLMRRITAFTGPPVGGDQSLPDDRQLGHDGTLMQCRKKAPHERGGLAGLTERFSADVRPCCYLRLAVGLRIDLAQTPKGHGPAQRSPRRRRPCVTNAHSETNIGSTISSERGLPVDKAIALPHLKAQMAISTLSGQGSSPFNSCSVICAMKFFCPDEPLRSVNEKAPILDHGAHREVT